MKYIYYGINFLFGEKTQNKDQINDETSHIIMETGLNEDFNPLKLESNLSNVSIKRLSLQELSKEYNFYDYDQVLNEDFSYSESEYDSSNDLLANNPDIVEQVEQEDRLSIEEILFYRRISFAEFDEE